MSGTMPWEHGPAPDYDGDRERRVDGQGRVDPRPPLDPDSTAPRWDHRCEVCGQSPVVSATGLCGPCTFGEAETAGGNW